MNTTRELAARHSLNACLERWGWQRSGGPADEIGECTDYYGCSRPGRWWHPYRMGNYCAQHAHQGGPDGFGGH